jgi:multiple antibiotic resistance protein
MHDIFLHTTTVFMGFFAMLNPIGNLPVYLGMVKDYDEKAQRRIAVRALLSAFLVIAVFSIFGHIIFRLFGITLPAFQIAGGVIVFIMGYQLLNAQDTSFHSEKESPQRKNDQGREDIAIMPLGIPLLAGPGTISTAMNFVGSQMNIYNVVLVIGVFAVICFITLLLFLSGKRISARLNPALLKVTSRIMGLILAVIAVQMMINGISGAYHLILNHAI